MPIDPVRCAVCKREFARTRSNQVTCSTVCSRSRYTRMADVDVDCPACGARFKGHPSRKFCDKHCRKAFYDRVGSEASTRPAEGLYVYMWFDEGARLPYYVGHGGGTRKDDPHDGVRPPHHVAVARSGLTGEGALLVESALIELLSLLGAPLVNERNPLTRQERPPLTI